MTDTKISISSKSEHKRSSRHGGKRGVIRGLKSINQVVTVRLAQVRTLTSDSSGGTLSFNMVSDPSSSGQNFSEFGQWSALYDQVRLLTFRCTFISAFGISAWTDSVYPIAIAGSLETFTSPASSRDAVLDNADSVLWDHAHRTCAPYVHTLKNPKPVWASVATPNPGDNIGCPGVIFGYGVGMPNSTDIAEVLVEGFYQFRSRK